MKWQERKIFRLYSRSNPIDNCISISARLYPHHVSRKHFSRDISIGYGATQVNRNTDASSCYRNWLQCCAQSHPVFIQLGRAKGALYKLDAGPNPRIGIVVMHRESNHMNHVACGEFAKRGFLVLCMNSRFENSEASVKWESIPLDVGEGVKHLDLLPASEVKMLRLR
ncbi:MAG: hypothetical protein EXR70_02300 [Deltaproteobacteria bacterium]|nr:hypothetical protein [Deltaproteobacteria bacterium]